MSWENILKRSGPRLGIRFPQLKQAILNVTQDLERFKIEEIIEDVRKEYARILLEDGIVSTPAAAQQHAKNRVKIDGAGSLSRFTNKALEGVFTNSETRAGGVYSTYYEREE